MAPIVHGLEAEYAGKIEFIFLDVDDPLNAARLRDFGFRYQPEFYLLDGNGNVIKKWVGRVAESDFRAAFDALP